MIKRKWRGYWLHKILDRTDESLVKDVCWSAYLGLLIFVYCVVCLCRCVVDRTRRRRRCGLVLFIVLFLFLLGRIIVQLKLVDS